MYAFGRSRFDWSKRKSNVKKVHQKRRRKRNIRKNQEKWSPRGKTASYDVSEEAILTDGRGKKEASYCSSLTRKPLSEMGTAP